MLSLDIIFTFRICADDGVIQVEMDTKTAGGSFQVRTHLSFTRGYNNIPHKKPVSLIYCGA